jgi:hypothetical protein
MDFWGPETGFMMISLLAGPGTFLQFAGWELVVSSD